MSFDVDSLLSCDDALFLIGLQQLLRGMIWFSNMGLFTERFRVNLNKSEIMRTDSNRSERILNYLNRSQLIRTAFKRSQRMVVDLNRISIEQILNYIDGFELILTDLNGFEMF